MKSFIKLILILILTYNVNAQVGIGTTTPEGALDIVSGTIDGLLIPRVALTSLTDVTGVVTPTQSEMVYNTTVDITENLELGYYYLASDAGPWVKLGGASAPPPPPPPPVDSWLITGNDNIVEGTNFLGTVTGTNVDIAFRRNGADAGRIGTSNTYYGLGAGDADTAAANTYIGVNAGGSLSNSNSSNNVAIGSGALLGNGTQASNNVAIGQAALTGGRGDNNTVVGVSAGAACNGCNNNILMGRDANTGSGQGHIIIGVNSNNLGSFSSNSIYIGGGISNGSSNRIQIGSGATQTAFVNAPSWNTTSDRRLKSDIKDSQLGLDFIKTIRPVSYYRKDDKDQKTEFGFIAQELDVALKAAGITNTAIVDKFTENILAVRYNDFLPMTVKAVQEQQVLIEKLQKDNEDLKAVNAEILKRLEALEKK